jgi:MFS family permease
MLTASAVVTHIMPYLDSLGIPRGTAGLVAGAVALCSIIGRFGFGWLGDLFDKRFVMACSFLSLAAGLFTLCYKPMGVLFLSCFSCGPGWSWGAIRSVGRQSSGKLSNHDGRRYC